MKKHLFSLLALGLISNAASAQLVIDSADLVFPVQPQSVQRYVVDTQLFFVQYLSDFRSGLHITGRDTINFSVSDNDTAFGTTTYMQDQGLAFGTIAIPGAKQYFEHNATGIYNKGINISAFTLPLGATDSIVFDDQKITYDTNNLWFPFSFDTNYVAYTNSYNTNITFNLTYPALMINNAPGNVKRSSENQISFTRYSQLVLPYGTDTLDVAVMKYQTRNVDSFFINNSPINPMLLTGMGLTQGDTSYVTKHYLIGKGYHFPLGEVVYNDTAANGNSRVVYLLALHEDSTTAINKLSMAEVKAYPNPAENWIKLSLKEETIKAKYIYDITGKLVKTEENQNTEINIADLNVGQYILRIKTTEGKDGYLKFIKK